MWIDDTIVADGIKWLRSTAQNGGGQDMVLLLVYPIVGGDGSAAGGKEGGFTRELMKAYRGDTIVVVGTQNGNGYTGFKTETMDEYMEREWKGEGWRKVVQCPLPSFAGKDEALFVFQRGEALGAGGNGANGSVVGVGASGGTEGTGSKPKKRKKKSGKKKNNNNNGVEAENKGGENGEEGKEEVEVEGGDK